MLATVMTGSTVALLVLTAIVALAVGWAAGRALARRRVRMVLAEASSRLDISDPGDDTLAVVAAIERAIRLTRQASIDAAEHSTRLQVAIDSMVEAVMVYDSSGSMLEHNAAAQPFLDARHGDALVGAALGELLALALDGEPGSTTLELFGPPRRWVVITVTPMATDAGFLVVAMVEDITDRRLLEAVRTDFVANISHELKTPVGAIALLAETLEVETDPEVAERLAARIHVEALRVGSTIEDLLELSRIESAAAQSGALVDMVAIVGEAVTRLRPAAEQAGVEIKLSFDNESVLMISGDRRQLQSAVTNLLDNAVKYSDPGSTVEVGAALAADRIVVTISDHGIGIPTRDLERIFERFYRVDQARSRATGGTGLGLAIVRHIVANHGGNIEVESRLGEGSTFTLALPQAPETADVQQIRAEPTAPANRS